MSKWRSEDSLKQFYDYFHEQWIEQMPN
ncbi:unnamed protein product, partial [Rotaria sp. Silwood2]